MKKITNPAPPLQMATKRNPLTVSLSMGIVEGGTLTQTQDNTRGLWDPDRELSGGALILYPELSVSDPDGERAYTPNATYDWYVDALEDGWDAKEEKGHVQSTAASDLFYLETKSGTPTGRLVVRKNVSSTQPKRIILVATFTDSARQETYREEVQVALSCENRPDDFFTVSLLTPSAVYFRPLTDDTSLRTIQAEARQGSDVATDCKFFWYIDDVAITDDGQFPCYQAANQPTGKGLGTDTIVLDMDFLDDHTLTVKVGETSTAATPLAYTEASCSLMWGWPSLELWPYAKGDSFMKDDDTEKGFGSVLHCDGVDCDQEKRAEYLRQRWFTRNTANSAVTYRDWGEETTIDASALRTSGGVNIDVDADLYLLSPLELLTHDGEQVTHDGENVWGRT